MGTDKSCVGYCPAYISVTKVLPVYLVPVPELYTHLGNGKSPAAEDLVFIRHKNYL